MKFLLDTNTCIHIINGKGENILLRMMKHHPEDFGISILTKFELLVGVKKKPTKRNLENWKTFENRDFTVIEFSEKEAAEAASIQAELESVGRGIGEIDTCLAGTARARKLIMVTSNYREFSRVKDLKVEDWNQ